MYNRNGQILNTCTNSKIYNSNEASLNRNIKISNNATFRMSYFTDKSLVLLAICIYVQSVICIWLLCFPWFILITAFNAKPKSSPVLGAVPLFYMLVISHWKAVLICTDHLKDQFIQ